MYGKMQEYLRQTLAEIKEAGLYKEERLIESAQQAAITVKGKEVLNFCANNYLGLSNHPRLIKASQEMMNNRGYGMSSVRFICCLLYTSASVTSATDRLKTAAASCNVSSRWKRQTTRSCPAFSIR